MLFDYYIIWQYVHWATSHKLCPIPNVEMAETLRIIFLTVSSKSKSFDFINKLKAGLQTGDNNKNDLIRWWKEHILSELKLVSVMM